MPARGRGECTALEFAQESRYFYGSGLERESVVGHLKWLSWGAFLLGMTVAVGSSAGESGAGVLSCRAISEPRARLACFDRQTALLAGSAASRASASPTARAGVLPPAPPPKMAHAVSPLAPPLTATEQFGLTEGALAAREVAAGTRVADVREIKARVTAISRSPQGTLIFTLDNGQAWKQLEVGGDLLVKVGDTVSISRGWFHSFNMTSPSRRFCKVDRIR